MAERVFGFAATVDDGSCKITEIFLTQKDRNHFILHL